MAPLTHITEWCLNEVTLPDQQVTNLLYYYYTIEALITKGSLIHSLG